MEPLALYIHFPWCVSKCPYCDFNSFALHDELPQERYIAALARDLESQVATLGAPRSVSSVFLGGGTPSLFAPDAIARVLAHARSLLPFESGAEITLEANPGTIERGRFAEYAAAGVNRVSLGAQSFDAATLVRLGRIHTPAETQRAAEELHAAGLANFNLDLMYALPGQSPAAAELDVALALALSPAQVSHYQLTLEPGTPFAAVPPAGLPADDDVDAMLERCQAQLAAAGYERYEISAYARAGRRCAHNLNYWRFGDYLGVGAGAHGKVTRRTGDGLEVRRTVQLREPRRYLAAVPGALAENRVAPAQLPFEFMLNALRLLEGCSSAQWVARTGLPWSTVTPELRRLADRGLVDFDGPDRARPSPRGLLFLNDALVEFLPSETHT
jgi:oxygen-independent coproporphyrinogen-3 oxidase